MSEHFTMGMMHDMGKKMMEMERPAITKAKNTVSYPNMHIDDKRMPELKRMKMGDKMTLHAHALVKGMQKFNDEPASYDLEIHKMGMKPGHNPFRSKAQQRFMFAAEARGDLPKGTARRWAHETPSIKKLPERVKRKKKQSNYVALGKAIMKGKKRR